MNMISPRPRMSPLTAMFLGLFFVGGLSIASVAAVMLYTLRIVDHKATGLINFADRTIEGLPELLQSLPPALADVLHDRRAPEYAGNIDVAVKLIREDGTGSMRPVLTVKNTGVEVVSMLALRVAALDDKGVPQSDWTEVVATPLTIDNDWRGPLMPGATRHVVLSSRRCGQSATDAFAAVVEIGDVRVWENVASQ